MENGEIQGGGEVLRKGKGRKEAREREESPLLSLFPQRVGIESVERL